MYYSENARKKKDKELESNQKFIDYARKHYEECKEVGACGAAGRTFEEFLLREVFNIYDNFELLQFLETADKATIDKVTMSALKGL